MNKTMGLLISHKNNEKRRAILPEDVKKLRNAGMLYFETGYGDSVGHPDQEYIDAGAQVVSREEALKCDIITDVKLGDADYLDELEDGKLLFGWAHAAQGTAFTDKCLEKYGTRIFFCGDEFYLKAGLELPDYDFYEDFAQLENGVGMMRMLITEFEQALEETDEIPATEPFSIATGVSAAPFMDMLYKRAKSKFPRLECTVYPIVNDFFGHTIDVAGLVTGGDLIAQLRGKALGKRLLIPQNMLRHGEGVFLDDVTLDDVERELKVKVVPVMQDGRELFSKMTGGTK